MELLVAYSYYRCYYLAKTSCLVQQWLAPCSSTLYRKAHLDTYEAYCQLSCSNMVSDLTFAPLLGKEDAVWTANFFKESYRQAGLEVFRIVKPMDSATNEVVVHFMHQGLNTQVYESLNEVLSELS